MGRRQGVVIIMNEIDYVSEMKIMLTDQNSYSKQQGNIAAGSRKFNTSTNKTLNKKLSTTTHGRKACHPKYTLVMILTN